MFRSFLFVGCGGSGAKTVRLVRRKIEQRLTAMGYDGPIPDAWQFLVIDVPTTEDSSTDLLSVGGVRYVGLADQGLTYRNENGADLRLIRSDVVRDNFAQWRPDPMGVHTNLVVGAGQQRAVGRVVLGVSSRKAMPAITQAATACSNGRASLDQLAAALNIDPQLDLVEPLPTVILISSLGGGSGSGAFIDVADMLRMSAEGNNSWLQNNLCAVLYDPSVFDRDGTVLEAGVPPNSLAAISELVTGQWTPWSRPEMLNAFQGELGNYGGPEYPFLVGSSNGKITYTEPAQVYEATAEALTAWVVDPELATSIESYTGGNWTARSASSTIPLHGGTTTRMPLSSLGFARVGLGRKRFASYAEERMARSAVERLLTRHHTAAVVEGRLTDAQAANQRFSSDGYRLVTDLLRACGLDEHSDPVNKSVDSNQVLDAIRDQDALADDQERLREQVAQAVTDKDSLLDQFEQAADLKFEGVPEKFLKRHQQRAVKWAESVQDTVLDEVLKLVSNEGLPVAALVLGEVTRRVGQEFPKQLIGEKTVVLSFAGRWQHRTELIKEALKARGRGISTPLRELLKQLMDDRIYESVESDLRDVVADLLQDMAENFLAPLHRELLNAIDTARSEQITPSFKELATKVVPTRLRPAPNELILEEVDDYPKIFEDLLTKTSESVDGAIADVIQGRFGSDKSSSRAPESFRAYETSRWIPRVVQVVSPGSSGSAGSVRLRLDVASLRRRSGHWMRCDVQTPIGRHMSMSLREYLNDKSVTDAVRNSRAKRFGTQLNQAFERGRPLAELAGQWAIDKFGTGPFDTVGYVFSKIPLAAGDVGFLEAESVVMKHTNRSNVSSEFVTSPISDIEIFATMRPVPPSAFGSLVYPITTAWRESVARQPRGDGRFWQNRRARPLDEHVPLPEPVRHTLARGWTIGRIMDRIRWDDHEDAGQINVGGAWKSFVHPPLGGLPPDRDDEFGSVLTGALLAEMLAAAGNSEHLDALIELLRLGGSREHPSGGLSYPNVGAEFSDWLMSQPDAAVAASDIAAGLRDAVTEIEKELSEFTPSTAYQPFPLRLATGPLQARAMSDIAAALERFASKGVDQKRSKYR